MTTYYIVIENSNYSPTEKIVGVYEGARWRAEEAQLNLQQDRAASYNIDRQKAYEAGGSFEHRKTADDFMTNYSIKQVHQPNHE